MLKTIVVPLDGYPLAERALSLATGLSIPTGARLVLVRVFAHDPPSTEATSLGTCRNVTGRAGISSVIRHP